MNSRKEELKKSSVPYIGFGNEELKDAETVKVGDLRPCPKCGALTEVKDGSPPGVLQFISHCGSSWLAGINNKYVGNKKPSVSGKLDIEEKEEIPKESAIEILMESLNDKQWSALAELTNKQLCFPSTKHIDKENILKDIKEKYKRW